MSGAMTSPLPIIVDSEDRGMKRPVEEVARAFVRARGAAIIADGENWPQEVARYHEMVAKWPDYAAAHSLITDAFSDARTALDRLVQLGFLNDNYFVAKKAEEAGDAGWGT